MRHNKHHRYFRHLSSLPLCALLTLICASAHSADSKTAPAKISADMWNQLVRYTKGMNERLKKVETSEKAAAPDPKAGPAKPSSDKASAGEESIDLGASTASEGADLQAAVGERPHPASPHASKPSDVSPFFKVYFDLNFHNRPGITPLTFDNFHSFLLFEIAPTPELTFSFEVNPSPKYYELDYQLSERIQLRFGKIWIPFDDMGPHSYFGGRVNVSRLLPPNGAAFLPDLWTDLGVGTKIRVIDAMNAQLDAFAYVVNGFRSGGTDPKVSGGSPSDYPSFSDLPSSADNNQDKGLGGRLHLKLWRKFGLGVSYYRSRWNDQAQPEAKTLSMVGGDSQLRLGRTELRVGLVSMSVNLTGTSFTRGGTYVELGQKFGGNDQWKLLGRYGTRQLDNRVIDVNDQTIAGAMLIFQPGLIQYSIEHSRDLDKLIAKSNYSFTNLRIVIAL